MWIALVILPRLKINNYSVIGAHDVCFHLTVIRMPGYPGFSLYLHAMHRIRCFTRAVRKIGPSVLSGWVGRRLTLPQHIFAEQRYGSCLAPVPSWK